MAAQRMLRRGLPRVKGGEAWPPATEVDVDVADVVAVPMQDRFLSERSEPKGAESTDAAREEPVQSAAPGAPAVATAEAPAATTPAATTPVSAANVSLRRGLPRVAGGEPWPPSGAAATVAPAAAAPVAAAPATPVAAASSASDLAESTDAAREEPMQSAASGALAGSAAGAAAAGTGAALRRGLPRVAGGDPWPPAGAARVSTAPAQAASEQSVPAQSVPAQAAAEPSSALQADAAPAAAVAVASGADLTTPLPFTRTVWQGRAPRYAEAPEPEPSKLRPTWPQAIGGLLGLAALGLLAVAAVFFMRMFLSFPFMQDFLAAYPGEYHPPIEVEPGFAPWANWAHFFNMFLMVLIIRSGLRVRSEKRPTVFWTPRGDSKGKISLTLWFHQALDLLWIINGIIFVVLIIVTGHWVRIVPTSWEVFPNALSAGLQYISLDWPAENGWVNYNSLQQLAYFTTVFIAAPLAVVTGFRMSGLWPKKAEKLSKAYPVEWARALHFPVMLYFVAFIIAHVALVFLTGALRNLNHMFAAQGSVDGAAYASVWTGFWVFVVAIAVIVGAWFAARPLVLAPIAKLFGQVSGR